MRKHTRHRKVAIKVWLGSGRVNCEITGVKKDIFLAGEEALVQPEDAGWVGQVAAEGGPRHARSVARVPQISSESLAASASHSSSRFRAASYYFRTRKAEDGDDEDDDDAYDLGGAKRSGSYFFRYVPWGPTYYMGLS